MAREIRIRMLGKVESALGTFRKGDEVDLRPEDAQPLLDAEIAERVTKEEIAAEAEEERTAAAAKTPAKRARG